MWKVSVFCSLEKNWNKGTDLLGQISGEDEPDVIAFNVYGVTDTELANVLGNELMLSAMYNLTGWSMEEPAYSVQHSAHPVEDFSQQTGDAEKWNNFFE